MSKCLSIKYGILEVGKLYLSSGGSRASSFRYVDEWLKYPFRFNIDPELKLIEGTQSTDKIMFGFVDDMLPERYGAVLIREKQGRNPTLLDCFQNLRGNVIHGALYIDTEHNIEPMSFSLLKEKFDDEEYLYHSGCTLGGSHKKMAWIDPDKKQWIVKFGDVENEASALFQAEHHGINVANYDERTSCLLVERFDRHGDKRIPFMSAKTAIGNGKETFENVLNFIRKNNPFDADELFRRIHFDLYYDNTDNHLKNTGFLYLDGKWNLAPAYDITSKPNKKFKTKMLNDRDNFDKETLEILETEVFERIWFPKEEQGQ